MITARFVSDEFEICLVCACMAMDGLCDSMRCGSQSGLVLSKIVLRNHLAQSDQWHCGSRHSVVRTLLVMPASVSLSRDIEEIYRNLWRADVRRDRDPSLALLHHRIVTCLVWALSGSSALAEAYLLSKRVTDLGTTVEEYSPERCVLLFSEWLLAEHDAVLTAMMDIENSYRVQADCFLVRSLTALMVHIQSQKGVLVPSSETVYYYLRLWSLRPVSTALQPLLTRLTYHRNARRKFGQLLRQEWMLDYGSFKTAAEITEQETHERVLRFGTYGFARVH